jgi:hypothetical protein
MMYKVYYNLIPFPIKTRILRYSAPLVSYILLSLCQPKEIMRRIILPEFNVQFP